MRAERLTLAFGPHSPQYPPLENPPNPHATHPTFVYVDVDCFPRRARRVLATMARTEERWRIDRKEHCNELVSDRERSLEMRFARTGRSDPSGVGGEDILDYGGWG